MERSTGTGVSVAGPHRCLGSHLAGMVLTLVIDEWLSRIPDFEVEPGITPEVLWPANTFGLASLPPPAWWYTIDASMSPATLIARGRWNASPWGPNIVWA